MFKKALCLFALALLLCRPALAQKTEVDTGYRNGISNNFQPFVYIGSDDQFTGFERYRGRPESWKVRYDYPRLVDYVLTAGKASTTDLKIGIQSSTFDV